MPKPMVLFLLAGERYHEITDLDAVASHFVTVTGLEVAVVVVYPALLTVTLTLICCPASAAVST